MYIGLSWVALATGTTAGLIPSLLDPEPTSEFNLDYPLLQLPPKPYGLPVKKMSVLKLTGLG
jgi:hypothetical protein